MYNLDIEVTDVLMTFSKNIWAVGICVKCKYRCSGQRALNRFFRRGLTAGLTAGLSAGLTLGSFSAHSRLTLGSTANELSVLLVSLCATNSGSCVTSRKRHVNKETALHESKDPHSLQVADRKCFTLQSMWDSADQLLHLKIISDKDV